jgi:hypothetical protein
MTAIHPPQSGCWLAGPHELIECGLWLRTYEGRRYQLREELLIFTADVREQMQRVRAAWQQLTGRS